MVQRKCGGLYVGLIGLVAASLLAHPATAAESYLDVNGDTASPASGITGLGTYSWEDAVWSSSSNGNVATTGWTENNTPSFAAGSDAGSSNYTVTANANHTVSGMQVRLSGGANIRVNGSGTLILPAGLQPFNIAYAGQNLQVYSSLIGPGGVSQQGAGQLWLYGNNTYSGGTRTAGGQTLSYNRSNSFGTGTITLTGSAEQRLVEGSPTPVTIPNPVVFESPNTTTSFVTDGSVFNPGATWSGSFTLPTTAGTTTFQAGAMSSFPRISGIISGGSTAGVRIASGGMITFAGHNIYSGPTTLAGGSLVLGVADAILSSREVIFAGGTLNPDAFVHRMNKTTVELTANSAIDYGLGAAEIEFADSSTIIWNSGAVLNLMSWTPATKLRFGFDAGGLTAAQLTRIQFNGDAATLGTARLDARGYVVPEPTALLMMVIPLARLRRTRRR